MNDSKVFFKFIDVFYELIKNNINIEKSLLLIINFSNINNKVKKLSLKLLNNINNGYSLYNAFKFNSVINIKNDYLVILDTIEKSGNVLLPLQLLKNNNDLKRKIVSNFINLSIYPFFVFFIITCGTFILIFLSESFNLILDNDKIFEIVFTYLFFVIFIFSFVFIIKINVFNNYYYDLFFIISLYIQNGISLYNSICDLINFSLIDSKKIKSLKSVKNKLNIGSSLVDSFSHMKIDNDVLIEFELCTLHGDIIQCLKNICNIYEKKYEKKIIYITNLVEPLLILSLGLFLFNILKILILPIITNWGGIL